jgi:hypothetical protein
MKATLDDVAKAGLVLPSDDKAVLAEKIAQRLGSEVPPKLKRKQLAKVMRRRREIRFVKAQGLAQAVREIQLQIEKM